MFLTIDPNRPLPLFSQIMEGIRLAIATGRVGSGDRIPSIRELAVELRVNPNTVAKAYQELERQGVVEAKRGAGYYVTGSDSQAGQRERRTLLKARIDELLSTALELGFSPDEFKKAIQKRIEDLGK